MRHPSDSEMVAIDLVADDREQEWIVIEIVETAGRAEWVMRHDPDRESEGPPVA